jgi:3-isopropylmalate/(R)-2-methylmalate dehydratase small subunit
MDDVIEARAWVFGDSVDTDTMYPGFAMKLPIEKAAKHVFYDLRPGWTGEVSAGDIVIAGKNFGIGSSRPVAQLFKQLGIAALVAEEFNSLFLRSINLGLPAVTIPGVTAMISDQDQVVLDVRSATIERVAGGTKLTGSPLPDFVLAIVAQGGLLPKLAADGYIPTDPLQIYGAPSAPGRERPPNSRGWVSRSGACCSPTRTRITSEASTSWPTRSVPSWR